MLTSKRKDVAILESTGKAQGENLPRNSLFHKILPASYWIKRFCRDAAYRSAANRNEIKILAKSGGRGDIPRKIELAFHPLVGLQQ